MGLTQINYIAHIHDVSPSAAVYFTDVVFTVFQQRWSMAQRDNENSFSIGFHQDLLVVRKI